MTSGRWTILKVGGGDSGKQRPDQESILIKVHSRNRGTFIWGWKLLVATMEEVAWLCRKDIAF